MNSILDNNSKDQQKLRYISNDTSTISEISRVGNGGIKIIKYLQTVLIEDATIVNEQYSGVHFVARPECEYSIRYRNGEIESANITVTTGPVYNIIITMSKGTIYIQNNAIDVSDNEEYIRVFNIIKRYELERLQLLNDMISRLTIVLNNEYINNDMDSVVNGD